MCLGWGSGGDGGICGRCWLKYGGGVKWVLLLLVVVVVRGKEQASSWSGDAESEEGGEEGGCEDGDEEDGEARDSAHGGGF